MGKVVELRTLRQAVKHADSWQEAYSALRRSVEREVAELEWQLLIARSDLLIEQSNRLLERIAWEDECERLRGLIK